MKIGIGYGDKVQYVEIQDKNLLKVLEPNIVEHHIDGEAEVRRALENPTGAPHISHVVKPGEKVVIITSDITRPVPSYAILPPLLETLYEAGICKEDITLIFALGIHRSHSEDDKK